MFCFLYIFPLSAISIIYPSHEFSECTVNIYQGRLLPPPTAPMSAACRKVGFHMAQTEKHQKVNDRSFGLTEMPFTSFRLFAEIFCYALLNCTEFGWCFFAFNFLYMGFATFWCIAVVNWNNIALSTWDIAFSTWDIALSTRDIALSTRDIALSTWDIALWL